MRNYALVIVAVFLWSGVWAGQVSASADILQDIPPQYLEQYKEIAKSAGKPLDGSVSKQKLDALPTQEAVQRERAKLSDEKREADLSSEQTFREGKAPSKIERIYREYYRGVHSSDDAVKEQASLSQFGYELFKQKALGEQSYLAVPQNDYVLGPGDSLVIRLWGNGVDGSYDSTIERDGTISVPKLGVVSLGGVKLGEAEGVLKAEAEKYLQGIHLKVHLKELRSLEIYVIGAVQKPGLQLVPAFSTVVGGLEVAGIKKVGSLRNVQIFRDGKRVRTVDLYDLLLHGNRGADLVLQNKDVVFVPPIGRTFAVMGGVPQQGIFELKNEKTVQDAVQLAGGLLPHAYSKRVYLHRVQNNRDLNILDLNASRWRKCSIANGDLLEIPLMSSDWKQPNAVYLEGHVWRPDVYNYRQGLKLSDVLTSPSLLKPNAITSFGIIHRYDQRSARYTSQRFELRDVLCGKKDMALAPLDRIEILSREDIGIVENVSIHGAVWQEGAFEYQPGLTIADLIALAGGTKFGANGCRIELSRQRIVGDHVETVRRAVRLSEAAKLPLTPYDSVFVPQVKDATNVKYVTLGGEVKYPGKYSVQDGERLSNLIARAGGFTPDAYYYGAMFTSEKFKEIQQKSLDQMVNQLELRLQQSVSKNAQTAISKDEVEAVKVTQMGMSSLLTRMRAIKADGRVAVVMASLASFKGSAYDFVLHDGDSLQIPAKPSFVSVVGSVYSPKGYLYRSEMTVGEYLDLAGGITKSADEDSIYIIKANGEVASRAQSSSLLGNRFKDLKLMPGDSIVVPEDFERIPYLRLTKDIADIVFKIATTAGIALAVL